MSSKPVEIKSVLPSDPAERKQSPLATGLLDYFPLALAEVARVSKAGNDQHNLGQELHWERGKSQDHPDCIMRHLADRGLRDSDGQRHSAKGTWRFLALLEEELEAEGGNMGRASWVENEVIDPLRTHIFTGSSKCWSYDKNSGKYCTFQKYHTGNHENYELDYSGNGIGLCVATWPEK